MSIHIDYPPIKECKHPEWTYGVLCVKCGECGRYDRVYKCVNCGYTEGKKLLSAYKDWGSVEFYDVFDAPICPKCRQFFKKEDRANYREDTEKYGCSFRHEIIPKRIADFTPRRNEATEN